MAQPLTRYLDGRRYTIPDLDRKTLSKTRQALYHVARMAGVKIVTRSYPDGRLDVQAQR